MRDKSLSLRIAIVLLSSIRKAVEHQEVVAKKETVEVVAEEDTDKVVVEGKTKEEIEVETVMVTGEEKEEEKMMEKEET